MGPPAARATTATAVKSRLPLVSALKQRHALRAAGQPVAGAFHVRAGDDLARFRQQRRAHSELANRAPPRLRALLPRR